MDKQKYKMPACCFTGHRPDKMDISEKEAKDLLEKAIDKAIEKGYCTFISGMAKGTDVWAGEIVLERKKQNKNIQLICALPHPKFEKGRNIAEKDRYNKILKDADFIKEVNDRYFAGCYQARNKWMVDNSSLVIAVFNGGKSGTKNTVDYAKRKGICVLNVLEI